MKIYKWKILAVLLTLVIGAGCSPPLVYAGNDPGQQTEAALDYILGRPMTEEEKAEQEALVPELKEMPFPDEPAEPVVTEGRARSSEALQVEKFDLREEGLVTEVKDQVVDGPCWAFSAIAMAEAGLLGQGTSDVPPDLSEEHLAYFFYNRKDDPLGNTQKDRNVAVSGGDAYKSVGGNLQLASKFLSTWSGAASESVAPYQTGSPGLDGSLAYEAEVHLQNARFIDPSVEELKEAIYTGRRPVGITYYHHNSYWNKETGAYCYPHSASGINHAVTIVGWDDHYSSRNFLGASNVTGDGAWIVKNSWGSQSGDQGYIYISYEDKSLDGAVWADFGPADNYDHNYQYDGSSGSSSVAVSPGASHANVFQVKGNPSGSEVLKAVGILVSSANVELSIDVYTELTDPSDPSKGVHSIADQKVSTSHSGYYTFPLEQEVALREDSYFSVVFTNRSNEKKSFSIESASDSVWIRFDAGVESGQSFYQAGAGKEWQDMNGNYLSNGKPVNARIKAYTSDHGEPLQPPPTEQPAPVPEKAVISNMISEKKKITLQWKKCAYADSYEVYRSSVPGGSWERIGTTEKTSYTDKGLSPASAYRYRVRGAGSKTGSDVSYGEYSNIQKVLTRPQEPKKVSMAVSVRAGKKTKAVFTWKASAGASGYEIRQYDWSTGKYVPGYKIEGSKVYIYKKAKNKYKKIGTMGKSGGRSTAVLTKIDLKTYKKQRFKVRAYVDKSGYRRQYSNYSGKIILK